MKFVQISKVMEQLNAFRQHKIKPRVVYSLIIHWVQNYVQILCVPFFLHNIIEVFWVQPHTSRLAILPVRGIPPSLGPVNDCFHSWIRSPWQKDVGRDKVIMCEHNGCFPTNFNSTGTLELLDSIWTLKWPSEFWMACKKNLIQWLPAQATYRWGSLLAPLKYYSGRNLPI